MDRVNSCTILRIAGATMLQCCACCLVVSFTIVLSLLVEAPGLRAEEQCEGSARRPHDLGKYQFTTTSRVYSKDGAEWYDTCVENNGDRDLWIDWYVPGPFGYVLPEKAVPSHRIFSTRDTVGLDGCLEYGNLAELMREHFLGHASDVAAIEEEKKKGCDYRATASVTGEPGEPGEFGIQELTVPFRLFLPSNKKYAEQTMLEITGEAKVIPGDTEHYSTVLAYTIEKVKGRQAGNPNNVFMRPLDTGLAGEFLRKAFFNVYFAEFGDKGIPLKWSNKFLLRMDLPEKLSLTSTRYGFFDQSGEFVGAIFVPLWAPIVQ